MAYNCRIYLVFSPHQALAVDRIIRSSAAAQRTVIITTIRTSQKFTGCEIISFLPLSSFKNFAAELVFRNRRKTLRHLFKTIEDKAKIELLVPHYQHILSNYLAFFLLSKSNVRRALIPDGILSLYEHRVNYRDIIKQTTYKIFAITIGLNFKFLWRSINFPDDRNSEIYTYFPDCVYNRSAEVISIPVKKRKLSERFSGVVILGTNNYRRDHFSYAKQVVLHLNNDLSGNQVYFKKHPALRGEDPILRQLRDQDHGFAVREIPQSEAIEGIIERYSLFKIIDLAFSTSTVELQLIYCNKLDISVYEPILLSHPRYSRTFRDLMDKFNLKQIC